MGFVLGAEARELHADQVLERCEAQPLHDSITAQFGRAREDEVDRAPAGRLRGLDEHVDPGLVAWLETKRLRRFCNPIQILPAHGDVDVPGEAAGVGIQLLYVQVRRQAADNSIVEPR